MGILIKMAERRAIKKIARNLPPFLVQSYGGGAYYTTGQVSTAVEKTGCNGDYIDHAYAMFCSEEDFNSISDTDYETIHNEVSEICFGTNTEFSFSDFSSLSEGSVGEGSCGGGD